MFNYETKCAWSDRNQGVLPNGRYPLDGAEGEWKGLKSIGIEKKTLHRGEEEEREYRYYISPENRKLVGRKFQICQRGSNVKLNTKQEAGCRTWFCGYFIVCNQNRKLWR